MANENYRLSPYCVFWLDLDGKTAQLANGRYGSRFEVAADVLRLLLERSKGASLDDLIARAPDGASTAISMLVDEKVLVPAGEADEWIASDPFRNRLSPLELAFHRGVNEGGYFANEVDTTAIPLPAKEARGGETFTLRTHDRAADDVALTHCLDRRRSIRTFGAQLLSRALLERFLELTARAYALWPSFP